MTTSSVAYGFDEFLVDLANSETNPNDAIFGYLSTTNTVELQRLINRLTKVRSIKPAALTSVVAKMKKIKVAQGQQARIVGLLMEKTIRVLLNGCKCISHGGNVRTNTSEIDFLIKTSPMANLIPIFKKANTHLLGEAKCYASGVKSEWITELVGMMHLHNTDYSILFVASPPKVLRVEHRHTVHFQSAIGKIVVPFGISQLTEIVKGKNFLKVLSDQYVDTISGAANLSV
jgi:hypothetical protein